MTMDGSMFYPSDRQTLSGYLRFMEALESSVPEAKRDLLHLLPYFSQIVKPIIAGGNALEDVVHWIFTPLDNQAQLSSIRFLREKLDNWAIKYHLESNRLFILTALRFLADACIYDLEQYEQTGQVATRLSDGIPPYEEQDDADLEGVFPFLFLPLPDTELAELLKVKGIESPMYYHITNSAESYEGPLTGKNKCRLAWNPTEMAWAEFDKLVTQMLRNYMRAYRRRAEEAMKRPIFKTKRKPIHYQWLVDYQVKGMSYQELAGHYTAMADEESKIEGFYPNTIYKAVKEAAKLVGLTLRIDKGGHPSN